MMKQYCKIDSDGNILDYLLLDEYGSIPIDCKQIFEGVFHNPKYSYELREWVEGLSNDDIFYQEKLKKFDKLKKSCSLSIIGRFKASVDGVDYYFSCDHEAQINFGNSFRAFQEGWITTTKWTCYNENDEVCRVELDAEKFRPIYIGHLAHISGNIARLRDYMQPLVMATQTMEELESIQW